MIYFTTNFRGIISMVTERVQVGSGSADPDEIFADSQHRKAPVPYRCYWQCYPSTATKKAKLTGMNRSVVKKMMLYLRALAGL